jgi:hypothetical protein
MDKTDLRRFFEKRSIDTRHVPVEVLAKAHRVVERLEHGESYLVFHGKRIRRNRNRISIPLGLRWRILADDLNGKLRVRRIMSHQTYSALLTLE